MKAFATVDEAAAHYVATLNAPANAWGRQIDKEGTDSGMLLVLMFQKFGRDAANKAIDEALEDAHIIARGNEIADAEWGA